jgi:hypothetical protein
MLAALQASMMSTICWQVMPGKSAEAVRMSDGMIRTASTSAVNRLVLRPLTQGAEDFPVGAQQQEESGIAAMLADYLFTGTAASNIRLASPAATDAGIEALLTSMLLDHSGITRPRPPGPQAARYRAASSGACASPALSPQHLVSCSSASRGPASTPPPPRPCSPPSAIGCPKRSLSWP